METNLYKPAPILAPYIEAYMIACSNCKSRQEYTYFHPSTHPILCFDLKKEHFKESGAPNEFNFSLGMVGVMDHFMEIEKTPEKSIQVIFKPYGAFRFFHTPMNPFVNRGIDIQSVLPNTAEYVHQLQDHYDNNEEIIKIIDQFLSKQLQSCPPPKANFNRILYACETLRNSKNAMDIRTLCQKVGMSETRFRVQFKEKIGISPKKFYQIETFQQIQQHLQNSMEVNWMDLVVKYSFYDQTHFIKKFKWFFGCTPSEYSKRLTNSTTAQLHS